MTVPTTTALHGIGPEVDPDRAHLAGGQGVGDVGVGSEHLQRMVVPEAPQRDQGVGQRPPGGVLAVDGPAQIAQEAVHLHAIHL